jgi:putative transcriptional regulator
MKNEDKMVQSNSKIIVNLDVVMAKRKMSLTELSEHVGISMTNLSNLKTGKARAIRFTTLAALCEVLDCQPGELFEYRLPNIK